MVSSMDMEKSMLKAMQLAESMTAMPASRIGFMDGPIPRRSGAAARNPEAA